MSNEEMFLKEYQEDVKDEADNCFSSIQMLALQKNYEIDYFMEDVVKEIRIRMKDYLE